MKYTYTKNVFINLYNCYSFIYINNSATYIEITVSAIYNLLPNMQEISINLPWAYCITLLDWKGAYPFNSKLNSIAHTVTLIPDK